MHSITVPKTKYIVLSIKPLLKCRHWACKRLTEVAHAEPDGSSWLIRPVCFEHGYAERDHGIGFSLHDSHNSIRRFVIESLQLQGIEPHSIRVHKCFPNQAGPYGYEPIDPLEVFADQATVDACHIPDIAWLCRWNGDQGQNECIVVWSYDLIEFRAFPIVPKQTGKE